MYQSCHKRYSLWVWPSSPTASSMRILHRWKQAPVLKFMWKDGSKWLKNGKGFWATLIVHNLTAGVGKVQQLVNGSWVTLDRLDALGQMFVMEEPDNYRTYGAAANRKVTVRIYGSSLTTLYGSYIVSFSCSETAACSATVDATAVKQ
jgi:hypothetical protein